MNSKLSHILALSGEAALFIEQGRIVYCNAGAERLLGPCLGREAAELLGAEYSASHARAFVLSTQLQGAPYLLRVNRLEAGRLVFLHKQEEAPIILNDPFLYSLRSNLMTLGMAADKLRPAAEDLRQRGMQEDLTSLTSSAFKLMRLSENVSLVRDLFLHRAAASPVELDLALLCHSVLDAAEDAFPELCFRRELPDTLRLNADPKLLKLLLFNLLSNALIHARPTLIQLRLRENGDRVLLSVGDNGCGIPTEALSTVFERYRYDFGLSQMGRGAGLGLSAARAVAQLHGGTLLLESREDQGTLVQASLSRGGTATRMQMDSDLCSMRDLLLGLADCLPLRCFEGKYLD